MSALKTINSSFAKAISMAVCLTLSASVISSKANQVTTAPGYGPWLGGGGGEFTVTPDAPLAAQLGVYSPFTMNQGGYRGSFQTFCVERNEYLAANTTYDVTLNNVTVFSADPLSAGVAYLYSQFATGALDYNYANLPTGLRTSGAGTDLSLVFKNEVVLENAIWYLMNPILYSGQGSNPYVLEANAALGGALAALAPAGINNYGVKIMNMWTPGQPHDAQHAWQDVLIYTVPEPSTFALLSIAGLIAIRRRT